MPQSFFLAVAVALLDDGAPCVKEVAVVFAGVFVQLFCDRKQHKGPTPINGLNSSIVDDASPSPSSSAFPSLVEEE